jgi:hypothetical protein
MSNGSSASHLPPPARARPCPSFPRLEARGAAAAGYRWQGARWGRPQRGDDGGGLGAGWHSKGTDGAARPRSGSERGAARPKSLGRRPPPLTSGAARGAGARAGGPAHGGAREPGWRGPGAPWARRGPGGAPARQRRPAGRHAARAGAARPGPLGQHLVAGEIVGRKGDRRRGTRGVHAGAMLCVGRAGRPQRAPRPTQPRRGLRGTTGG